MKILFRLSTYLVKLDNWIISRLTYPYSKVKWYKHQSRKLGKSFNIYDINQESVQPDIRNRLFKLKINIYLACRNNDWWEKNNLNCGYGIFTFIMGDVLFLYHCTW